GGQHVVQRDAEVPGELAHRRLGEDPVDRDLPGLLLLGGRRAAPTSACRGGAGAVADEVLRLLPTGGLRRGGNLLGDLLGRRIGLRLVVLGGGAGRAGRAGCVGWSVGRGGGGRTAGGVDLDQPGA